MILVMDRHLSNHLHGKTTDVDIRGVRMFLHSHALKSQNSKEGIHSRMMCVSFNSNPCMTIASC